MDLLSLNSALDRISTVGVTNAQPSVYDQIGLRPDDRKIATPPITYLVTIIEEVAEGAWSPKLKTNYILIGDSLTQASIQGSDFHSEESPGLNPGLQRDLESTPPSIDNSESKLGTLNTLEVSRAATKAPNTPSAGALNFFPPTTHEEYSPKSRWDLDPPPTRNIPRQLSSSPEKRSITIGLDSSWLKTR